MYLRTSSPTVQMLSHALANGSPWGSFWIAVKEYRMIPFAPDAMHCQDMDRISSTVGILFCGLPGHSGRYPPQSNACGTCHMGRSPK